MTNSRSTKIPAADQRHVDKALDALDRNMLSVAWSAISQVRHAGYRRVLSKMLVEAGGIAVPTTEAR